MRWLVIWYQFILPVMETARCQKRPSLSFQTSSSPSSSLLLLSSFLISSPPPPFCSYFIAFLSLLTPSPLPPPYVLFIPPFNLPTLLSHRSFPIFTSLSSQLPALFLFFFCNFLSLCHHFTFCLSSFVAPSLCNVTFFSPPMFKWDDKTSQPLPENKRKHVRTELKEFELTTKPW